MEKKNYIVGIDIGSSNIVMIVGSKNAAGEMVIEALVERASKGVNAGMIENINQVSECVKAAKAEAEERLGIRISEAYAGISGAFISCASLSDHVYVREPQSGISQSDVDALFLRMKEVVAPDNEIIMERIPQNYVVDGVKEISDPVGAFGRRLAATFNFILCEKTPLDRLNMVFRHSGMELAGVYANPMIMSEALLSEDEKMDGAVVVDEFRLRHIPDVLFQIGIAGILPEIFLISGIRGIGGYGDLTGSVGGKFPQNGQISRFFDPVFPLFIAGDIGQNTDEIVLVFHTGSIFHAQFKDCRRHG